MATPRKYIVLPERAAWYHCVSRCVRRGFWCGKSSITGKDCSHRKGWIEARLGQLAQVFAIDQGAYAVMDNHIHVVVRLDPGRVATWSDQEVARRWLSLFPGNGRTDLRVPTAEGIAEWLDNPANLPNAREKLGCLSYFMGRLNQWLAHRANKEEQCKGRFLEGRFHSQRIEDAGGLLATMIYVDLNPVRARIVSKPEDGPNTSIRRRLELARPGVDKAAPAMGSWLMPIEEIFPPGRMNMPALTLHEYVQLVDAFGRVSGCKKGSQESWGTIPAELHPILERFGISAEHAPYLMDRFCKSYFYVIGSPRTLRQASEQTGRTIMSRSLAVSLLYITAV